MLPAVEATNKNGALASTPLLSCLNVAQGVGTRRGTTRRGAIGATRGAPGATTGGRGRGATRAGRGTRGARGTTAGGATRGTGCAATGATSINQSGRPTSASPTM